ncbi:S8 family serine peptidase [Neobacillus kokaensis]|uniref:Peptidase S8/S53 domain-containing protein n=1 Tax=Neobacillus kokaensis TaxID=2759023 RepID=A0ABQ3N4V2_9BACI|nr:S8 family serine peptidase [Neobacillus kokaensis]GHH99126.1 hypothetical protein AM1BK_26690 [Neobacillus kokaensis]
MNANVNLLVGFHPDCNKAQRVYLHQVNGCKVIKQFPEINVEVVTVPQINATFAFKAYHASPHVTFVETEKTYSANFRPNDPFYKTPIQTSNNGLQCQWGLRRTNPEQAWDQVRNRTPSQIIAILDTGIDPNHPDLAQKIVSPANFTTDSSFIDINGHGTHVAGVAAAVTNNKTGIAGMSFNTANIMPVKVLGGPQGQGQTSWIVAGILYAVNNGANVINMSLGSPAYSQAFQLAINFAWNRGLVIVASAGNNGNEQIQYPAGYNYVFSVSATNQANDRAYFSSWGMDVGVTAPGIAILSTTPTYPVANVQLNYDALSGTSQAAPFVAGLAVMLRAIYPQLSNQEIIQVIQRSAKPIDAAIKEWDAFFGYGLIDASNAVKRTSGKAIRRQSTLNQNLPCSAEARTSGNRSSGRRNRGKNLKTKLGSFYGQVVNQNGNPIGNARVFARRGNINVSMYTTKTNVLIDTGVTASDGMFRLPNLQAGSYGIFVALPGQAPVQITTATITPGADLFLRLVV